jgi:hypothetical protein
VARVGGLLLRAAIFEGDVLLVVPSFEKLAARRLDTKKISERAIIKKSTRRDLLVALIQRTYCNDRFVFFSINTVFKVLTTIILVDS